MNPTELREKSELANRILENDTPYLKDKNRIYSLFLSESTSFTQDIVEQQLTIIDSYYSTNMSKRYYGIEQVAESIVKVSNNLKELELIFSNYKVNPHDYPPITKLFDANYGYTKIGKEFGHARSLISKYAYFVTHFNFPIYDSIVKEVYQSLHDKKLPEKEFPDFLMAMQQLLISSNVENYNKLDNLLWLVGKILRGNYSLILRKDKYLRLVSKIDGIGDLKSVEIDEKIMKFSNENIDNLSDIFTNDQIAMIKYCRSLIKIAN